MENENDGERKEGFGERDEKKSKLNMVNSG